MGVTEEVLSLLALSVLLSFTELLPDHLLHRILVQTFEAIRDYSSITILS